VQGTDEPFVVSDGTVGQAVRFNFNESNNHAVSSDFSAGATSGEQFGFVWVMRKRADNVSEHPIDGGFSKELSCFDDNNGEYDFHRNGSAARIDVLTSDTNWHVFYVRAFGGGDNVEFYIDGSTSSGSVSGTSGLSGLTVGERGDLNGQYNTQADYAEVTVIQNGTKTEFEREASRMKEKYGL
jgi:hypothetical protein